LRGIFKGKKVLITGNTGFKGSWLSIWLHKLGAEVHCVSVDVPTEPSNFKELNLESRINHTFLDIREFSAISNLISAVKPDFIFHLAAQSIVSTSYKDPIRTIETNILGTSHVLESLRLSNHECVAVIITSDKCYDNVEWVWGYKETDRLGGKDIYSGSKGGAELVYKSYYHSFFRNENSNIKLAAARAGNVIGGGDWAQDRIVPDCIRSWSKGDAVTIRNQYATRPWQHVLERGPKLKLSPLLILPSCNFNARVK
jgi:CDP-glucose 4,6-dehydratase